ncbi:hypothetical protein GTY54_19495 [Streptomyces sp. SID625]|nr:hypothetical protein [Streptomyces sp. SID625]
MTTELLETMETVSKRFSVSPNQAAELHADRAADVVSVTWQQVTDRAPSVLVTVPSGADGWALPIPHRPDWLMDLIVKNAPDWWLK